MLRMITASLGVISLFTLAGCQEIIRFNGDTTVNSAAKPVAIAAPVKQRHAKVANGHIEIDEKVQFEVNSDHILNVSDGLLSDVADEMKENPQIKKVEIQGHASSEGDAKRNKTLSDLRAKAVMAALVAKGVEPARLTAKGYGIEKPIADNKTDEGREKNRRVEFLIIDPAQ